MAGCMSHPPHHSSNCRPRTHSPTEKGASGEKQPGRGQVLGTRRPRQTLTHRSPSTGQEMQTLPQRARSMTLPLLQLRENGLQSKKDTSTAECSTATLLANKNTSSWPQDQAGNCPAEDNVRRPEGWARVPRPSFPGKGVLEQPMGRVAGAADPDVKADSGPSCQTEDREE